MSFKSKLSSLFVMMFALAALSVSAAAQATAVPPASGTAMDDKMEGRGGHNGFGKGMRGGGRYMRELRGVNLTDAQKEQLRTIFEANKPDQATMEEMRSLMEARRAGTATAEQTERMKTLKRQGRAKREQIQVQVFAILTPEQRQQVEKNREESKQRREERRKNKANDTDKPTDN